jgi:hypothetical protein
MQEILYLILGNTYEDAEIRVFYIKVTKTEKEKLRD